MFYVYVLRSTKDDDLYIGYTSNLRRRIEEHNNGESFSTSFRRPFTLKYYEAYSDQRDVENREKQLKKRGQARYQLKNRISGSLQGNT